MRRCEAASVTWGGVAVLTNSGVRPTMLPYASLPSRPNLGLLHCTHTTVASQLWRCIVDRLTRILCGSLCTRHHPRRVPRKYRGTRYRLPVLSVSPGRVAFHSFSETNKECQCTQSMRLHVSRVVLACVRVSCVRVVRVVSCMTSVAVLFSLALTSSGLAWRSSLLIAQRETP